jgi:hypothetical protein
MSKLINKILNHQNLLHPSTSITSEHLSNNYIKNHLISINDEQNLKSILQQLNSI